MFNAAGSIVNACKLVKVGPGNVLYAVCATCHAFIHVHAYCRELTQQSALVRALVHALLAYACYCVISIYTNPETKNGNARKA